MRLGIFVMYDKHGIVDEGIVYLLKEMQRIITHMVIVCNGHIEPLGVDLLRQYSDEIYFRENIGYDASAYLDAFNLYIGWENLRAYEELVMFNATFFGPFRPIQEIFNQMENFDIDFWGLSRHGSTKNVTAHLQSYFLVVRKSLLISNHFQEFWLLRKRNLISINDVINDFEVAFTSFFAERGYTWTAYADTKCIEDNWCLEKNFDPCVFLSKTAIQKYGLPILKKRLWPWTYVERSCGNELLDAIKYVEKNTDYNIDIIWDTMIRCQDINELRKALHLHFVLPASVIINQQKKTHNVQAVIFVWIEDMEQINWCKELPENCDFILITSDPNLVNDVAAIVKIKDVRLMKGNTLLGIEILKLVERVSQSYEYIGFFFPRRVRGNFMPEQLSYNYNLKTNLLASEEYIDNICYTFESNPRAGIMTTPLPYYGNYQREKSIEWGFIFDEIECLIKLLELRCELSRKSESQVMEMAFWVRINVIYELAKKVTLMEGYFKTDTLLMSVLPRVLPYIAQHLGYYTAIVENADFAGMHLEGLTHKTELQREYPECDIYTKNLLQFCWRFKKVYIYGAGKLGKEVRKLLLEYGLLVEGFVVSDGKWEENQNKKLEVPIYVLKCLEKVTDIGIVIALNDANKREVQKELEKYKIKDVYFI